MTDESKRQVLLPMVTEIVAAHLSNNTVAIGDINRLINEVYGALTTLSQTGTVAPAVVPQEPAVPVNKNVPPDHIIPPEDRKKLKMPKRAFRTAHRPSPEQNPKKWRLPGNLPIVAPKYPQ